MSTACVWRVSRQKDTNSSKCGCPTVQTCGHNRLWREENRAEDRKTKNTKYNYVNLTIAPTYSTLRHLVLFQAEFILIHFDQNFKYNLFCKLKTQFLPIKLLLFSRLFLFLMRSPRTSKRDPAGLRFGLTWKQTSSTHSHTDR